MFFPCSGMMSKAEHSVHNEWFKWITKQQEPQLDLISKISKTLDFKKNNLAH